MSHDTDPRDEETVYRARYEALIESHGDLISRFQPDGTLTFVSPSYCEFFDKSPGQLVGRSIFDDIPADEQPAVRDRFARLSAERPSIRGINTIESAAGERRTVDWVNTVICDAGGRVLEIQSVGRDITGQRRIEAELERSNEEFAQFAFAAAHDLKAPLRNLRQLPEVLRDRIGDGLDAAGEKIIGLMIERVARMDALIEGLLTYARVGSSPERGAVDLNRVLDVVRDNLEQAIAEAGAEVVAGELPVVDANEIDCVRLLQNLLINALKYRREQPPRIEISAVCGERVARLSVGDNGIGIDPNRLADIFKPLQRLHHAHEIDGAGLGLTTCQKICRRYGGEIEVESTPGQGSVFRCTLPLAGADATA